MSFHRGIDERGRSAVVKTTGNDAGFVILRGGRGGPNYAAEHVARAAQRMREVGRHPAVMVDCSHANAAGDYRRQEEGWRDVVGQATRGDAPLVGLMVESNIHEGKQPLGKDRSALRYGVSLTDGCIGWEQSEALLREAHAQLVQDGVNKTRVSSGL